jgi:hypothetical protein
LLQILRHNRCYLPRAQHSNPDPRNFNVLTQAKKGLSNQLRSYWYD